MMCPASPTFIQINVIYSYSRGMIHILEIRDKSKWFDLYLKFKKNVILIKNNLLSVHLIYNNIIMSNNST